MERELSTADLPPDEPRTVHAQARDAVAAHIAETIEELQAIEQRDCDATSPCGSRDAGQRKSLVRVPAPLMVRNPASRKHSAQLQFDPFPFGLLTTIVSLEAILLSVFILMSEHRQAERDASQTKLDLEVNLIAEREVTKVIALPTAIHNHLGIELQDAEVEEMNAPTKVEELVETAERITEETAAAG